MTDQALIKSERENRVSKRSAKTSARISHSRWAAYATAGAASALVYANSAEAGSFYSGIINIPFNGSTGPNNPDVKSFALEGGPVFSLGQAAFSPSFGFAGFRIRNSAAATGAPASGNSFAGKPVGSSRYVYKLNFGAVISAQNFVQNVSGTTSSNKGRPATMAFGNGYANSQWAVKGTGYIGFKFNDGTGGIDYGWARVTMDGPSANTFTLNDYYFGDNRVTAGAVPDSGSSLGLLALGCVGLLAWRSKHTKSAAA